MEELQKAICAKYGSPFFPPEPDLKVGLALATLHLMPITGVRINPENGINGWYIYGGDYSDDAGFYSPVHQSHLASLLPLLMPYLALAPGFKFIVDNQGYEDVWYEPHQISP